MNRQPPSADAQFWRTDDARVTAIGLTAPPAGHGMQYRNVGRFGLRASAIGVGCYPFGGFLESAQSVAVVHAAMVLGINYFDTANSYGVGNSEEMLGAALQGGRGPIATKFANRMTDGPNDVGASRTSGVLAKSGTPPTHEVGAADQGNEHDHRLGAAVVPGSQRLDACRGHGPEEVLSRRRQACLNHCSVLAAVP